MKSLRIKIKTKKNRLKRRSDKIFKEISKTLLLIGIVGILACLMVYTYNFIISASCFKLSKTYVRGCEKVAESEVIKLAGIAPGENILTMNLEKIEQRIKTNPWIGIVSVGRELPNRLVIDIIENQASALVNRNGNLYIIDCKGKMLKKFEKGDCTELPVLSGFCENGIMNKKLLEKAVKLIDHINSHYNIIRLTNISEIHGDKIYGFSLFTDKGLCLKLGFGNYFKKFELFSILIADLEEKKFNKGLLSIDLSNCEKPYVQRKNSLDLRNNKKGYHA